MADLHITLTNKTEAAADVEAAKVYQWLTSEVGNKGLPSNIFDCVAFVAHETTHNRLLRNSLTRQVRLRVVQLPTEIVLSIRYDGEPFNDLAPPNHNGPKGIQGIIALARAQYGADVVEGDTTAAAGETFYTTTRINFPIPGRA